MLFSTNAEPNRPALALILDARHALYQKARHLRPERWSKQSRDWTLTGAVHLNPQPKPPEVVSLHLSPLAALAGMTEPTDRLVSCLNTLGQI